MTTVFQLIILKELAMLDSFIGTVLTVYSRKKKLLRNTKKGTCTQSNKKYINIL